MMPVLNTLLFLSWLLYCVATDAMTPPFPIFSFGRDLQGQTELHQAVVNNNLEKVRELMEKYPAILEQLNNENQSALDIAVHLTRTTIATYIAKNIPEKTLKAPVGAKEETLLHMVINHCPDSSTLKLEILNTLVQRGVAYNHPNTDGDTPLISAAQRNHVEVVEFLCNQKECAKDHCNQYGNTAVHEATAKGYDKVLRVLIDHGCSLTKENNAHETPLAIALLKGEDWKPIVRILKNESGLLRIFTTYFIMPVTILTMCATAYFYICSRLRA